VLDVGLLVANNLIAYFLAGLQVFQIDGCTEDDSSLGVDSGGIDDMRMRELGLQSRDAALEKALTLFRRVVLRVLGEIAVRARLGDRSNGRGPVHRLEPMQLGSEFLSPGDSQGDLVIAHSWT